MMDRAPPPSSLTSWEPARVTELRAACRPRGQNHCSLCAHPAQVLRPSAQTPMGSTSAACPKAAAPADKAAPQLPGPRPDSLQGPRAPTRHTPFSRPWGPRPITPDLGSQAPRRDGQASSSQGPHLGLVFHSAWSGRPGAQFVLVPCTQTLGLPVSPRVRLGWYLLIFSQASVLGPRPRCLVPHTCSAPSKHTRELFCPLASRAPKLSRWRPCSHVAHGYI